MWSNILEFGLGTNKEAKFLKTTAKIPMIVGKELSKCIKIVSRGAREMEN